MPIGQTGDVPHGPIADRPTSQMTVERVLRWNIGTGVWQPGDPLPSERQLASQLSVGRTTLRAAIHTLRAEGLLVTSTGRNGRARVAESASAAGPTESGTVLRRVVVDHFELRCVVQPEAAAYAAERGTTAEFERLRAVLRHKATTARAYHALESRFDLIVADACGNPKIRDVIAELCVDFLGWADRIPNPTSPIDTPVDRALGPAHRAMYESLMTRDVAGARSSVRKHLISTRDFYLSLVGDDGAR